MKSLQVLAAVSLAMVLGVQIVAAQDNKEEASFQAQFRAQLQEWLPGMGAEKIPDRRDAQQKFQQACVALGTPGREAQRTEACQVIAEVLGSELAKPARIWLLWQLEFLGRQECVDAVAKSLDDNDARVRDAARRALTNNSAPTANAKLLAKLSGASGTWRVGLINSIGFRGDAASVGALAGLLGDKDRAAAAAAANALAKIGGGRATGALKAALSGAADGLKVDFADAYLRCADKMLGQGKGDEAVAIYNELATPGNPRVIRLAALKGRLNAAAKKAADVHP